VDKIIGGILKGSRQMGKKKTNKNIPANVSTSTLAGLSFFFLVGFSSSAAVLSPSKPYNFASTNCCNGGEKKEEEKLQAEWP
jgi:hypothetical protein